MVPFCKLICYISISYGNGDGDGDSYIRGWTGMGTTVCGDGTGMISKLVAGIHTHPHTEVY